MKNIKRLLSNTSILKSNKMKPRKNDNIEIEKNNRE